MNKNRLEAFSDGVFAIVITLLILDVRITHVDYPKLPGELFRILPNIAAYVISFAIVGVYWVGHHYYFSLVKKTDGIFTWLNMLLLLLVAFLPFPTSLLGAYPFQTIPVLIFGCTLLAINVVSLIMLLYIYYHKNLAMEEFGKVQKKSFVNLFSVVNLSYVLAILLSPFFPAVSYIGYIAVIIFLIYIYATRY